MKIIENSDHTILVQAEGPFSLEETLFCGQCFTFTKEDACIKGVVGHIPVAMTAHKDGLCVSGMNAQQVHTILLPYLDLLTDFSTIQAQLCSDPILREAVSCCGGIRLLRQDPFETLISFIVSQNNNIPRIQGILGRLRTAFGANLGDGFFDFPTPAVLASLTLEDLAPLRSGFRGKYILDAAKKVHQGEVNLSTLPNLSLDEARTELMKINGVGPKVADCVLLFALNHFSAFPRDVWIIKTMDQLYPDGMPLCFSPYEGYAQQYLFHYVRTTDALKK